jgi:hypothetical protein
MVMMMMLVMKVEQVEIDVVAGRKMELVQDCAFWQNSA